MECLNTLEVCILLLTNKEVQAVTQNKRHFFEQKNIASWETQIQVIPTLWPESTKKGRVCKGKQHGAEFLAAEEGCWLGDKGLVSFNM